MNSGFYCAQFFIWLAAWAVMGVAIMIIASPPTRVWPIGIWTAATFILGMFYGFWVASVHMFPREPAIAEKVVTK
jgi:hypothetical protein